MGGRRAHVLRSVASFFDSSLVPKRKPWGPQYAVSHRQCHCFIHGSGVFRQCHSSLPNDALSSIVIHCFHSAIWSLAESSFFSSFPMAALNLFITSVFNLSLWPAARASADGIPKRSPSPAAATGRTPRRSGFVAAAAARVDDALSGSHGARRRRRSEAVAHCPVSTQQRGAAACAPSGAGAADAFGVATGSVTLRAGQKMRSSGAVAGGGSVAYGRSLVSSVMAIRSHVVGVSCCGGSAIFWHAAGATHLPFRTAFQRAV